jgi:ABC-type dipeptide/oligopeptide/nickel transport system permease subunit
MTQSVEPITPELDLAAAEETTTPSKSLWRETIERLLRKPSALVGLFILGTLMLIAVFAPVIATHDPLSVLLDVPEEGVGKRAAPCIHLLGCPSAGDNLFSVTTDTPIQIARLSATNSLLSTSSGNEIQVWKADDGKLLFTLQQEFPVTALDWNPNDQKILSASDGDELLVWDVNRRQIDRSLELEGGADFVQWNADGTRFLTAQGQRVLLWDTLSWRPTATIELDGERVAVAWNSNGTLVMTASGTTVALWNVFTGTAVATLDHDSPLTSAVFNKTTSKLLTTTASGTLHIWNASTFQEELVIEHDGPLANGAWAENISRGVQYVMASSDNTALVWSATNGEPVLELDHGEPVEKIAGSPLATRIFTQGTNHIRVWDAGSGKEVLTIERPTPIVEAEWQNTGGGVLVASGNELDVVKTSNYQYLMGVDGNVRDQFSRVIYGTRLSLMVGFVTVTLAVVVGTVSGAIAGFLGGWVDNTIMRVMDVMLAFPSLILAIAVVTVLGPGLINALLAISIVFIPAYARVARSGVLAVREEDFVIADRALGVSNTRILFHRILPNALAPLIVQATLGIGTAILDAAALSFLGLGAQPPTPEWGAMLGSERNQVFTAPHLVFYPGIAIMITVLAFNLLGDGLRDALDPRLDR